MMRPEDVVGKLLGIASHLDTLNKRNPALAAKMVRLIASGPAIGGRLATAAGVSVATLDADLKAMTPEQRAVSAINVVETLMTELGKEGWTFSDVAALITIYRAELDDAATRAAKEMS